MRPSGHPTHQTSPSPRPMQQVFDGVVCFGGGDWWYHNRGHYDMQMMRELGRRVPVLYVNSIGIRVPRLREGGMFFRRVSRKLRSLGRGFVKVRDRFGVLSPLVLPGRLGVALSGRLALPQIRLAARRMGITRPLLWITCPPGCRFLEALGPIAVVYQRTDRWESYPEADSAMISELHRVLRQRADLTLFCATLLFEEEGATCRRAAYLDHGVDYEQFAAAGRGETAEPPELRSLPRPRAGFVGAIDASTFNPQLFVETARRLPDVSFVCVGGCTLPEGWVDLPNVTLLGKRPYEEVAAYMAACDVLIMPWNDSEWIRACNPVKLKEYLAVGRPVVSTPFHELRCYEGLVSLARTAEEFALKIREALERPTDAEALRDRVRSQTWRAKGDEVLAELERLGFVPDTT